MAVLNSQLRLSLLDQVTGRARVINSSLNSIRATQSALLGTMGRLAAFGGAYLGVTAGMRGTVGAALAFEDAFADVRKVMNGTDEQLDNVRRQIIGMSKELPIAASGIAEIYAAAAQANIPMAEIQKFSEMVAKVSTAWDVPVKDTGEALAKIKTQLGLGVTEVGLFADSLNHLSNNTAATAPTLLEYTKRVAATGEMFGFSAQETLAFGGSMIAAGAESEVAATSFRNMGRALTKGTQATKMQRTAFGRLGLDAVKTAKAMQKNALKTTLGVIEKIQKLPEWEQISVTSALFGDEARALMPVINNSTELRRQLGLVGDQANYAGSAFEEYTVRANTVGNVLQILRNKFADTFRGDGLLAPIKEAALGIGDVLDTLGERGHIFVQMEAAMKGFRKGMGLDGGIRDAINDLGDLLFGEVDGSSAADKIGRIFKDFEAWGASIRKFREDIADNPIVKFMADLAPYAWDFLKYSIGISAIAAAIRGLAKAMFLLSGASTILAALKAVKGISDIVGGVDVVTGDPKGKPKGKAAPKTGKLGWLGLGAWGAALGGAWEASKATSSGNTFYSQGHALLPDFTDLLHGIGKGFSNSGGNPYAAEADQMRQLQQGNNVFGGVGQKLGVDQPVRIDAASISEMTKKTGTQDVKVVNPVPPTVNLTVNQTISGVSDPQAAANAAAEQIGQVSRNAYESSFSD